MWGVSQGLSSNSQRKGCCGASLILGRYLAQPPSWLSHNLVADRATPDGQAVVSRPAEKLKGQQHQGLPFGFL